MSLAIVECRNCGTAYWTAALCQGQQAAGPIAGGPCCFGHAVLDIERYPTERAASKAYPAWAAADAAAMQQARIKAERNQTTRTTQPMHHAPHAATQQRRAA